MLAAEPAEGNDTADAEAAASRPSSALPMDVEAAPEPGEAMKVEGLESTSLEEPSELMLPPELAEPPDKPCSDLTMVSCTLALLVCHVCCIILLM